MPNYGMHIGNYPSPPAEGGLTFREKIKKGELYKEQGEKKKKIERKIVPGCLLHFVKLPSLTILENT
jgi:hypothetical protein